MPESSAHGRWGRLRHVLVLPLAAALIGGTALALTPMTAQADTTPVTATVVLRTPGSAEPLAQTAALSRGARLARQESSVPTADDQSAFAADASSLGLTTESSTPWSAVVHGSASAVQQLADRAEVSSVLLDGGPAPVAADAATQLWGYQLASAYQASSAAPVGTTPVIATIQFSGWDSTQLSGYVTNVNQFTTMTTKLPPVPTGAYTAIAVGGASTTSGGVVGGATEVALDQESLYATNPYAKQRAYFTTPSAPGMIAALNRVAADAQNMPGLVALSISWTFCESSFPGALSSQLHDMHQAMANVVAAGVTVFAASGDNGTNCNGSTTKAGANYPATDPLVVAVGGTSLTLNPTTETAWSGSGGGRSAFFPEGATVKKTVPDVAADADLSTGFYIWQGASGWGVSGGTSLATPVTTAGYVAELASLGAVDGGLGNVRNSFSTAPATAFRDVTSGSNGTTSAAPGYDQVTGYGAPLWDQLVTRLLAQPVIQVPATSTNLIVPVTVTAPAGQTFIGWATGSGTAPTTCATSAGKPATPAAVRVTGDGTWTIWAAGYVGYQHCFIVSTTTVVTGHTATPPPAPTSSPAPVVTTAPTTSPGPVTTAPANPTLPVLPVVSTTAPPLTPAPPGVAAPVQTRILSDVTPPAVTLSARQTSPATTALSYAWHATDTAGSGVQSVSATVFRDGTPVWTAAVPSDSTLQLSGVPGHSYRLGVVAVDEAGNVAGFSSSVVHLPYDDRAFHLGKAWHRLSSRNAFGGSYVRSATTGSTATVTVTGSSYTLLTSTGPADGVVAVYVDGRHVRDISLYSRTTRTFVQVALARFSSAGKHHITLLVKGSKAARAKGTTVVVDGLIAY